VHSGHYCQFSHFSTGVNGSLLPAPTFDLTLGDLTAMLALQDPPERPPH
jgi:hypothetical protein